MSAWNAFPRDKHRLIALHSTHTALQLPQSPMLSCRRNISFPANSYPLKCRKFHNEKSENKTHGTWERGRWSALVFGISFYCATFHHYLGAWKQAITVLVYCFFAPVEGLCCKPKYIIFSITPPAVRISLLF